MRRREQEVITIQDGQLHSLEFAKEWGLDYFKMQSGTVTANFVGLILKKNQILLSFPKHYDYQGLTSEERGKVMKGLLTLIAKGGSYSDDRKNESLFPMASYLIVQDYYRKYGLHFITLKERKKGYSGRIDWRRTMRESEKVIQENSIAFLPFVTVRVKNVSVFLSECMAFVLTDTYQSFSAYLNFLTPYKQFPKNPIFSNFGRCVKELKLLRTKFFKDTEKNLIDALIKYFEWKSSHTDKMVVATTYFEHYWESLVELYLEKRFYGITDDNQLLLGDVALVSFNRQETRPVEANLTKKEIGGKTIRFDHLAIDDKQKIIYIFDSKYYKEIRDFDYKQAFYYYYLRQFYGLEYTIHNGLIAPTSFEDYSKIHVNRSVGDEKYQDGLLIVEHYLNLKVLVEFAQEHLIEFRHNLKQLFSN